MIWKKDRLRPTQPYFVFDTENFLQNIYLQDGISHFYQYNKIKDKPIRTVPDGCIDISFEYLNGQMTGWACGTPLSYHVEESIGEGQCFGVRFMPGMQPHILLVSMKGLLDSRLPLQSVLIPDTPLLDVMAAAGTFEERIAAFLQIYKKQALKKQKPFGKAELVQSVKNMAYDSDGRIRVAELAGSTGYSERYINKIFLEEMGFSPKTFCKIIQFQRALEFLNYGSPDKMTDAAVDLGYYDQSQFIRDFSRYAGVTPRRYQQMVLQQNYRSRVKTEEV